MNFAKNLNKFMKKKGLNIPSLSEVAGISTATASNYTRGFREPHISKAILLAKALDISLDELCGLKTHDEAESNLTSGEQEILRNYRKLTNEDQRQMVRRLLLSYL